MSAAQIIFPPHFKMLSSGTMRSRCVDCEVINLIVTCQSASQRECSLSRYSNQPVADHGQTSLGPLRALQSSHCPRRPRRGHKQETVARGHQGTRPPIVNHISRFHPQNTVSLNSATPPVSRIAESCLIHQKIVFTTISFSKLLIFYFD